ncbi:VID27-domain-containing protein [Exidia glandulosa HHB12029]|uniref:VID27-domain-containing protein n=1 Tax=Exidia glandulosa HHB12029 TaxID=1314781 RepID=A0A166BUQ5_EXIGL|nr:VID27-domain-containing protein [Exidia glandulosa HHB12029]
MFMLRSLFGKVWNDPNQTEISQISGGSFYIVRPDSVKGSRECIFNNAMAAIRRVLAHEHQFQLVITRVFEEGEEQLLEEEEESDHERAFLIDESLQFRSSSFEGDPTFLWRDLDSPEDWFEFVASGTNEPTVAFFQTAMYKAMYERKFNKSSEETTDEDLQQFEYKAPPPRKPTRQSSGGSKPSTPAGSKIRPKSNVQTPISVPGEVVKVSTPAQLYVFNKQTGEYEQVVEGDVEAQIVAASGEYWLRVFQEGSALLAHAIRPNLIHRGLRSQKGLNWSYEEDTFGLLFPDEDTFSAFADIFATAIWEVTNGMDIDKLKDVDKEYILSSHRDVEMKDVDEDEDEVADVLAEEDGDDSEVEDLVAEASDEDDEDAKPAGTHNSHLTVGYKDGRAFVVRGNAIGVFSSADGRLKHQATTKKAETLKGKEFSPNKIMLHNQDASMVLMKPDDPHTLYRMDLERGAVVEEWKIHDDVQVREIAPNSKFAGTTGEQTIVGTSHNALFRIDPRVSGNKLVDSEFKQYATKNNFSSVATTASGKLAVGSEKGDLRLFDTIGKNAKTALPQMGDPIIGVDVTADGRWVVATCKTYLLLIDTLIGEGRYKGSLGFDRAFPAEAKPFPRRLQLKPEHMAYMGSQVNFSPARFNTSPNSNETSIVTSNGRFVIAWNFAKVKQGRLDAYEIKQYEDAVVQDAFRYDDDKNIIVALENNVLMVDKKALKKPTRTSLAPPRRSSGRGSGIVKAAY